MWPVDRPVQSEAVADLGTRTQLTPTDPTQTEAELWAGTPSPRPLLTHLALLSCCQGHLWPKADPASPPVPQIRKPTAVSLSRGAPARPLPVALQALLPNMGLEGWPDLPGMHPGRTPARICALCPQGPEGPMLALGQGCWELSLGKGQARGF